MENKYNNSILEQYRAYLLLEKSFSPNTFDAYLQDMRAAGENTRFLPGEKLPATLTWTADPAEAVAGAEAMVLAVPYIEQVPQEKQMFSRNRVKVSSLMASMLR